MQAYLTHRRPALWPFVALILLASNSFAVDELKSYLQAHGGFAAWNSNAAVEFELEKWPFGARGPLSDHHAVDLKSRRTLITSNAYRIGYDGHDIWAVPSLDAAGVPARHYVSTPFYFFAMPFVFSQPGVRIQEVGERFLGESVFDAYKITPAPSDHVRPADEYVAYFSTGTHQLRLVYYTAKDPTMRMGPHGPLPARQAILFDEWQDAEDLLVPEQITFYAWNDDHLGAPLGSARFTHVHFEATAPAPELFGRPGGAQIDRRLHGELDGR